MVDDERGTVIGKDIFEDAVEKYVSVYFLHCFAIIPGRGADKTVVRPFISSVEEVTSEPVFQTSQRFHALHDICEGDPFAEIAKQAIAE